MTFIFKTFILSLTKNFKSHTNFVAYLKSQVSKIYFLSKFLIESNYITWIKMEGITNQLMREVRDKNEILHVIQFP